MMRFPDGVPVWLRPYAKVLKFVRGTTGWDAIDAALAAARAGAKTRLIETAGCLGGVWTAGMLTKIYAYLLLPAVLLAVLLACWLQPAMDPATGANSKALAKPTRWMRACRAITAETTMRMSISSLRVTAYFMLLEAAEFRGVRRGLDRNNRFADALGLQEHELLGKVLFVLFKVVGDLGQLRNDRLGVGPIAE